MKIPDKHSLEIERIETLHGLDLLDTAPEGKFDFITHIASEICETPVCLISLIDEERQWFKSKIGFEICETDRKYAFCAHAILLDGILEIEDTLKDDRFFDNPFVTGLPKIRFYAGVPIILGNGLPLGTLCVIDFVPRKLNEKQKNSLIGLAENVGSIILMRKEMRELDEQFQRLNLVKTNLQRSRADLLNRINKIKKDFSASP